VRVMHGLGLVRGCGQDQLLTAAVETGEACDPDHSVMITHISTSTRLDQMQYKQIPLIPSSFFEYRSVPMDSGYYGMSP
jgi:hypothetical protein